MKTGEGSSSNKIGIYFMFDFDDGWPIQKGSIGDGTSVVLPFGSIAVGDAHPALDAVGALLRTGPTGTNVADIVIALRA